MIWEQNSENTLYFAVRVAINYVPAEAMELRGLGGGAGDEGNDDASIPGWFRASLASFEYTEFLSELLFSSWKAAPPKIQNFRSKTNSIPAPLTLL